MAYVSNSLSQLLGGAGLVEGNWKEWIYISTDSLSAITASGYFSDGAKKGMAVGDLVWIVNQTTPAIVKCQCTAIASSSLGGSPPLLAYTSATVAQQEVTAGQFGVFPRNLIDGGDATINPWQRGTVFSGIVATNTFTADRWSVLAGAASSASLAKVANSSVPGFSQAFVWGRTVSGAAGTCTSGSASGSVSVSAIHVSQVLETLDSVRLQGQPVTLSFWAATNSSASGSYTGGALGVRAYIGTGTDQSTASGLAGTWTGETDVISTTQVLTTTATRYSFTGTVPTSATQIGIDLSYTPTATAGNADSVIMWGVQLEEGSGPTPFEHRDVEMELALCQRYFYQFNETSTAIVAVGAVEAANAATFWFSLPVQMRAAPTVTVVAGSFAQQVSGATAAVSGFAAGATHTPQYITVVSTATATAGLAALLVSRLTNSGSVAASADL